MENGRDVERCWTMRKKLRSLVRGRSAHACVTRRQGAPMSPQSHFYVPTELITVISTQPGIYLNARPKKNLFIGETASQLGLFRTQFLFLI
jgi:hypothetical protein